MMLRECIRHEPLAKIILLSDDFYDFFKYVEVSTFDIASDAFSTFKVRVKFPPPPPTNLHLRHFRSRPHWTRR